MAAVAGDGGDGFSFWKMPMPDLDDLDPAAEDAAARKKDADVPQAAPPPVAWPPTCPADLGEPDKKAGQSATQGKQGRNRNKNRNGVSDKGAVAGGGTTGGATGGGSGHKRDDGWLPKAEYEAKKREERARKQREREQQQQQVGGAAKPAAAGADSAAADGRRGRRGRDTWQDIQMTLPKRPEPVEETADHRAKREAEEARLRCRDLLRSATTPSALQEAAAVAKELGLTDEVKLAERKLARMTSAS